MPDLPITNNPLYDFTLMIVLVIIGAGLATKADQAWGWLLVGLAVAWAFLLLVQMGLI